MGDSPRALTSKVSDAWTSGGATEVVRRAWFRARVYGRQGPLASLRLVSEVDALVVSNPRVAVQLATDTSIAPAEEKPFRPARQPESTSARSAKSGWSSEYDLGSRSQSALLELVRLLRPEIVIETGVAAGASTVQILSGLEANGSGRLVSIDVTPDVGQLVPPSLRTRWQLTVLPHERKRQALSQVIESNRGFQLFVHDSDHAEEWQRFEYELALAHAGPRAMICSDDVEASPAFLDFCRAQGLRPVLLLDGPKVMGLVRLTG